MITAKGYNDVEVKEPNFRTLTPGTFVCTIVNVENVPLNTEGKGNYLNLDLEFTEGEMTGYCKKIYEKFGNWPLSLSVSYKETTLWKFKKFAQAVEASNEGVQIDLEKGFDENSLMGKDVIVVLNTLEKTSEKGNIYQKVDRWNCDFITPEQKESGKYIKASSKPDDYNKSADTVHFDSLEDAMKDLEEIQGKSKNPFDK